MTSVNPPAVPGETHPHQEMINGLLQLAGWLTDHPELPLDKYDEYKLAIYLPGHNGLSDSERVAGLRQIAAVLDVEPVWSGDTHLYATRRFGPKVKIEAAVIVEAYMQERRQIDELGAQALREQRAAEVARAAEGQGDEGGGELAEADCADCRGTGRQRDGSPCADCLGKGRVLAAADPWRPEALIEETAGLPPADKACAVCQGGGQAADEFGICDGRPCEHCQGTGVRPPVGVAW